VSALYVYKCRNDPTGGNVSYGDWFDVLVDNRPFMWGGAWATAQPRSRRLFEEDLAVGDLILAWQSDRQAAVGVCKVDSFKSTKRGQEVMLKWLDRFDPPVHINQAKRSNQRLAAVRAFKQGNAGTLYPTTRPEAWVLLEACGSKLAKRFKP
jgi:hypothetical protein